MQQRTLVPPQETVSNSSVTIVFDGPPISGKSTLGRNFCESTGFKFFDMGDFLRNEKENFPAVVQEHMRRGEIVPDEYIVPHLINQVNLYFYISQLFVGVRSVLQAQELLECLNRFQHRVVYVKLDRHYDDCLDLMKSKRGDRSHREDDDETIFKQRWASYESHTYDVEDFFKNRVYVRCLRHQMTRDPEHDRLEILKLLQPHCQNYCLPDSVLDVVHVPVQ